MERLTTIDRVKAWLAPDNGQLAANEQVDGILERLIPAVSRLVMNEMGRDVLARTVRSETYPGGRTGILVLRQWPVLSVSSLSLNPRGSVDLTESQYSLEAIRPGGGAQRIYLSGGRTFQAPPPDGVSVTYVTGFVETETFDVPSSGERTFQTTAMFLGDVSVTVASDGTPVSGYTVSPEGLYTLPPALAGQRVVVAYSAVPADIEQAVIYEIGIVFRSRQRIGEASKALANAGGTVSYLPVRLSDHSREILNSYKRVVPA